MTANPCYIICGNGYVSEHYFMRISGTFILYISSSCSLFISVFASELKDG
jgi:hypothetical protein